MSLKKSTREEDEAARQMFNGLEVEETMYEAFKRDFSDRPFVYVGALFGASALGKMLWGLKNKPKDVKLSMYLIHTRMAMQGAVVGTLVLGMCHQMMQKVRAMK
uniref:HIG1 hypoxia inducible domain family, member 1A [Melopsittacus undulatus] n=1 Tax=Lepeophtheirus salmonis TaxID=72036 RepID=A0A0K2URP5_LEPSM|nr:HIG1 domain family member 1C-like [Lepeophtheirus salmonis]